MKFRTILLGTAAALAVAGTAHAADLAVAESVDYVKVCDAYGAGYWYVPGSDVCLKIGAYVLFDTYFNSNSKSLNYNSAGTTDYSANWYMYMEDQISVDGKWMTDLGAATVHIAIRNHHDAQDYNGSNNLGYVDTAYFKVGGLKAGWDASTFDGGMFNGLQGYESQFDHDRHQNQVQWSTTAGGWGFFLAAEDPRDNNGGSQYSKGGWPDIVGAVAGSSGPISWRWSAAATDTIYGTGWGTEFDIRWQGAKGIEGGTGLSIQAAVGNDAGAAYAANWAANGNGGTPWHVTAQGGIAWTNAFTTLLGVGYRAQDSVNTLDVSGEADFAVTKGFEAGVAVLYTKPSSGDATTQVDLRGKASF